MHSLYTLQQNQNMQRLRTDEEAQPELECWSKFRLHYYKLRKNPIAGDWRVGMTQVFVSKLQCRVSHCHPDQSPQHLLGSASMKGDWSGAHKAQQKLPTFLRSLESPIPSPSQSMEQ